MGNTLTGCGGIGQKQDDDNIPYGKPTSVNKPKYYTEQDMNNKPEDDSTLKTVKQNETSDASTANYINEKNYNKIISENNLTQTNLDPIEQDKNNTQEEDSNFKRAKQVKRQKKNSNKKITENITSEQSSSQHIVSNEVLGNEENEYENKENITKLLMSSTNPEIKSCGERINEILNELKPLKLFHKTTNYKRIDRELFKLMVKLDDIKADDNSIVKEERHKALTEIHELLALLDSKIQCKKADCIICKTGIELKKDKINVPVLESEIN